MWPIALVVAALAFVIRAPFLGNPGFPNDQAQFVAWSEKGRSTGLSSVYAPRPGGSGKRWCNYPPAYLHVLLSLGAVYDTLAPVGVTLDDALWRAVLTGENTPATQLAVGLYKVPAVVADGLLGALLVIWLGRRVKRRTAAAVGLIYVLIPAVIHNSAIWGQMDAIPTLLVVASLEMARRRRLQWMSILAALAVLTKAQALVMLPVWGVVTVSWSGRDWRRWASAVVPALVVIIVILLPFVAALDGVWDAYAAAAGYYPFTHLNGFSAWFLGNPLMAPHLEGDLSQYYVQDDRPGLLGLSPRTWGLMGVLSVWAGAMGVMWRHRADDRALFWAARLLPLAFFVLSTQMHERYVFPAIAIWAWSFTASRRGWVCWVLLSLCASINVLWAWAGPGDGALVAWCHHVLHRPWLGLAPGAWCSLVFIGVLVATLTETPTHRKVKKSEWRNDGDERNCWSRSTRSPAGRG
jgi:hypothetical protein